MKLKIPRLNIDLTADIFLEIGLTDSKALLIKEIKEAVREIKLIKTGKKQGRNANDFLNEL
jgi:hypothetical protein